MRIIKIMALLATMVLIFALPTNAEEAGLMVAGMTLVKVAGLLAFGLVLILVVAGRGIRIDPIFHSAVLLYISWFIFSFTWTMVPVNDGMSPVVDSQQTLKENLYALVICIVLFQVVDNAADLKRFALSFLLGGYWMVYLVLQNYHQVGGNAERYTAKGFDPNEVGIELSMILPMSAYLLVNAREWWWKALAILYVPLALFGILIGASRAGAIVLVIGLASFWSMIKRLGLPGKVFSMVALMVVLVGIFASLPEKTVERVLSTGQEISSGTLNERSVVWGYAYEEWVKSPIFGHGLGSFKRVVNPYNIKYTAHNSLVSIAVDEGIIGVILYLTVLLVVFAYILRLPFEDRVVMLSMFAVVVLGQMSITMHDKLYVWFAYTFPVLALYIKK